MYSGLLELTYEKRAEEAVMPEYFLDLNLNQIVRELQDKAKEYDIRSMYYRFPKDYETVCYRQEIYREIRGKQLEGMFLAFAKKMREVRWYKERHGEIENRFQYQTYFFNAVDCFIEGVEELKEQLCQVQPASEGLAGLLHYFEELCEKEAWKECRTAAKKLREMLSELRYELRIEGSKLTIRSLQEEKFYFDQIKELFPDMVSDRVTKDGILQDYLIPSPFAGNEELGFLETEILRMYRRQHPEVFRKLDSFYETYKEIIEEDVYRIEEELHYYLVYSLFQTDMEGRGCDFCIPEVKKGRTYLAHKVYDLALARKNRFEEKEVVSNSVQYREGERFFVVTGPNQGGKTTFARSLGQLVYFAMMGLAAPAESAVVPYFTSLLTHFSVEESLESGRGKLKEELIRLAPMMEDERTNCFVVLNELFTTAATYDAFVMGQRVLQHFIEKECLGVYVTHIAELTKAGEQVASLVALADEHDHRKRTFQIVRKDAEGVGYAGDIVEKHRLGYEELCNRLNERGVV